MIKYWEPKKEKCSQNNVWGKQNLKMMSAENKIVILHQFDDHGACATAAVAEAAATDAAFDVLQCRD